MPLSGRRVYDVRAVIDSIADAGSVLEASPKWAPNLVTAFARIEGGPVGIVANQPRYLGGVIDVAASQKGAEFVRTCNQYGVPLVVLVDTPGFLPGSSQESAGVIRHGAKLLHAFAASTVPRFTVVLRKAFGGAYITMNSKDLGADLYLAWNRAELGIMGAEQAVGVVHRRALAAAPDPDEERRRLADEYAVEHLWARAAARTGAVDEIIQPSETRTRLAWALSTMTRSYQPARLRGGRVTRGAAAALGAAAAPSRPSRGPFVRLRLEVARLAELVAADDVAGRGVAARRLDPRLLDARVGRRGEGAAEDDEPGAERESWCIRALLALEGGVAMAKTRAPGLYSRDLVGAPVLRCVSGLEQRAPEGGGGGEPAVRGAVIGPVRGSGSRRSGHPWSRCCDVFALRSRWRA